MSAFLCSPLHTAVVAIVMHNNANVLGLPKSITPKKIASGLRSLNNAALKSRYDDAPTPLRNPETHMALARLWMLENPGAHMSLVASFSYQCSEGDAMVPHAYGPKLSLLENMLQTLEAPNPITNTGPWSI